MIRKILSLTLVYLLALQVNCFAAISVGSDTGGGESDIDGVNTSTPVTSHTANTNFMIAGVAQSNFDDNSLTDYDWNTSEAMTEAIEAQSAGSAADPWASIAYLVNPTNTTANLDVTWDANTQAAIYASLLNLSGVDTSDPLVDTCFQESTGSGTYSCTLDTEDDGIMISVCNNKDANLCAMESGQTIWDSDNTYDNGSANVAFVGGYELITTGQTNDSCSVSWTNTDDHVLVCISLRAAAGADRRVYVAE